jgi:sugar phosphate isomerase/epimerase
MSAIRVACQTYTWEMLGAAWPGRATDLLNIIAAAGYAGVEITNNMIGEFAGRPEAFAAALQGRGLELAAFAYSAPSGFTDPDQRARDLAGAEAVIGFLTHFPGAQLALGGASHPEPQTDYRRLDEALAFYNAAGRLAQTAGVPAHVHPHSHHGSLLETAEAYQYLLDRLDPAGVNFGPDTGHIVRGGQDLLTCLRQHLPRIVHLHLKDTTAAGVWQPLGEGACDYPAVFALLAGAGYTGWVVAEEESEAARQDGVGAVNHNRAYLRSLGY